MNDAIKEFRLKFCREEMVEEDVDNPWTEEDILPWLSQKLLEAERMGKEEMLNEIDGAISKWLAAYANKLLHERKDLFNEIADFRRMFLSQAREKIEKLLNK